MKKLLVCVLIVFSPFAAAEISETPPVTLRSRVLTDNDFASIREIASRYPCAMLTLLHLMRGADTPTSGFIYTDAIPTQRLVSAVLDDLRNGSQGALSAALQVNPYSNVPTFTELNWSSTRIGAGSWQLNFRAEIRTRTGRALMPRHLLEPAVDINITPYGLRVRNAHLRPSKTPDL